MSILIFVIILSILVIVHELGHYLVARKVGIKVEEFGVGYPPRAKVLYADKRGTEYTLNWLPFGGFVRLYGEDGGGEGKRAFFMKPVGVRMMVVVAGAMVNFLFGVVAFGVIYTQVGIPTQYTYVKIEEIAPGSPAALAGIRTGDMIDKVEVGGVITPVKSVDEFVKVVSQYRGRWVTLGYRDKDTAVSVYVRPEAETPQGEGAMGVVVADFEMKHFPMWQMPFRGMAYGTKTAVEFGGLLLSALGKMVGQLWRGEIPSDVAGPVGIAYMAQREGILTAGWLQQINFAAILSINLAIVNVLPIPALDGGRLALLVIEGIVKKRVKPEIEGRINTVGFAALILLLILISVKDVAMVVKDKAVQDWLGSWLVR